MAPKGELNLLLKSWLEPEVKICLVYGFIVILDLIWFQVVWPFSNTPCKLPSSSVQLICDTFSTIDPEVMLIYLAVAPKGEMYWSLEFPPV